MNISVTRAPSMLESVVHHFALPPQLPGKQEERIDQIGYALTNRLLDASRALRDRTSGELSQQWECIRGILQTCKDVNAGGKLDKTTLLTEFRRLERENLLILHVVEQNAGLLIYRQREAQRDIVIFEAFEASALSEDVLAAENALQWDFPGCAVVIPYSKFANASFQDNLAAFLEQASTESIKRFAPRAHKAGSSAFESRHTTDPSLITQMLMTLLEAIGYRILPSLLRKRVHDDVCWTDGAEKPWRRCAHWLVLRVGIERHLRRLHGEEVGRIHYKFLLCIALERLMEDSVGDCLSPELLALLNAKLSRRLAKLEVDKDRTSLSVRSVHESMFATLGPSFRKTMNKTNTYIEMVWNTFKRDIRRPIPLLPRRAGQRNLVLTLPNSGPFLQQVLLWHKQINTGARSCVADIDVSAVTTNRFRDFANRYFLLSELETRVEECHLVAPTSTRDLEERCTKLARQIDRYLSTVADAYDSNPEQKSGMLLRVMELWMSMDQCATKLFGLLMEYNPGIPSNILDVLQLLNFTDMVRLREIEDYLENRHKICLPSRKIIFDDPAKGCFAERYFDESEDSQRLQKLYQSIEIAAEWKRARKEAEWERLSVEFEDLQRTIAESTCVYTTEGVLVAHDDRHCTKCYLERKARRMEIHIHEHPLPSNPIQAKAVVFELGCPKAFTAYRNATWRILGVLACPKRMQCREPRLVLGDYSELKAFVNSPTGGVSLASTTKSFLLTHYSRVRFPVSLDQVCVPNGLKFGYFDTSSKSWPGREGQVPTFAHHCETDIPLNSPFSPLRFSSNFTVDSNGPSSYETISSQTKCPSGLNIHEFVAYQTIFSGKSRRWLSILTELGSSNLNFSTEAVALLMNQLALHAGPARGHDSLRTVHGVFRDVSFCRTLTEQIDHRLDGISSNWRETNCMEMLLTLILRLCFLGLEPIVGEALELLEKARAATFKWIGQIRMEVHRSTDANTSRRCSRYALWAALLCRRTFAVYAEDAEAGRVETLLPTTLRCFIECSITLQDNMARDPAALPLHLKNALIRDLKIAYRMRFILRWSLEARPGSLESAVNDIWPQSEGEISRSYSEPYFLESPDEWWIQSTVHATQQIQQQTIHYHFLEGHLLVDGQPLGKLPANFRESVVLEQLFGQQSLMTYPSGLRGMNYTLAFAMHGHQIHLGFRNGSLIIQACFRGTVLELVPASVFGNPTNFDLPASLVDNCVHWLNVDTGVVEIRQRPDIWKSKSSNWALNVKARTARRNGRSSLVDPRCSLSQQIARIFNGFEHRCRLTVYQPDRGPLCLELRRLELSFYVNLNRLLECRQLRSEIDPDQDGGTWYGLRSKLVLRDTMNPRQRSIILPMGSVACRRNGFHVDVNIETEGTYCRYTIDDILGRLDCPAEPKLLYLKALLHACTSFILPDPLTSRMGTEEAFHCLKSGRCQPWAPLNSGPLGSLMSIAKLTPRREYYPRDLKNMQHTFWDPHLTPTIQHDQFRPIVEAICAESRRLSEFATKKNEHLTLVPEGDSPHLLHRSSFRRQLYQRLNPDLDRQQLALDLVYIARDRCQFNQARLNVFDSVTLIHHRASDISTTSTLAQILQDWPTIGGYDRYFDKHLFSDRLDLQIATEWGALANFCRSSGSDDMYRLAFLFAAISFRDSVDMAIVRTLIAFAILESLKVLDPPGWPSYTRFRQNHFPSDDYLKQWIKPCCIPYPGDERSNFNFGLGPKLRRKLEEAELKHEQHIEDECRAFAQFLLEQWPCPEPTAEGFPKPLLLDVPQALESIRPEWLRLFQNIELSRHLQEVQIVLDRHYTEGKVELPNLCSDGQRVLPARRRGGELPTLSHNLLRKAGPAMSTELYRVPNGGGGTISGGTCGNALSILPSGNVKGSLQRPVQVGREVSPVSREISELQSIVRDIANSKSTVQRHYALDMVQSLDALKVYRSAPKVYEESVSAAKLSTEISNARKTVRERFDQLSSVFEVNDLRARWLKEGGLWPCITPVTLLEQLRSTSSFVFGDGMKESLVEYGLSITTLQRLLRIEDAHLKQNSQVLHEEKKNLGHSNWQPLKYPDWLLLEIDANILIRHDQVGVAIATISPASGSNSVLQMNMGQDVAEMSLGKTSCIMPMVVAVLADTKKLVRVVVPTALLLQTAQLLQVRLGGLIGRVVRHIPFSRKTPTNLETIKAFYCIQREIMASSGVIVALPEHILSFMLSGLQRLSDTRIPEATQMIKVQGWMRKVCRDVLDECDFTLAVRTQLIYPSGSQTTVDGHPHRWETAEALLRLVEGHLWNLQHDFPQSIDIIRRRQSGFPMVFFLRRDVEDALIARLVKDIIRGQTSIVPTRECTQSDRLAIRQFISEYTIKQSIFERIRQMFPDNPAVKQNIYLVRGLLVHRILLLTLKKRWNVQYGLHPNRDPIAVPYHAKGVPSEQAEWGHPDVAILFTCLSFYYGGLDLAQLRQSLGHLVKSDDPSSEYDRWVQNSHSLPGSLREWNVINIDDNAQLMEIWEHVRYNVVVIDYFLNHYVFPKHAKQFQVKLQASGWDIPLFSARDQSTSRQGSIRKYPQPLTTGFSGTNDNRTMLPLTIKQEDLRGLSHTNAEVLTYLLQPRNRRYMVAADGNGRHLSELGFLQMLKDMKIRVLLDAGAQILEMDNLSLVKAWLIVEHDAPAAIYFNAENKPTVLYRHGTQIPLVATPFADNLDSCLVYLDEAHTRGTDLKMPAYAKGALTLGLGQTKDHTVQAAMRLRQLGTTQSIVFFAPPEVHQSILDLRKKRFYDLINSYDVICWLLQQTCNGIEQIQPLYFAQGTDFCRRTEAALGNSEFLTRADQRHAYLSTLRQSESQTLEQLYKPRLESKYTANLGIASPEIAEFRRELNGRRKGFQDHGNAVHGSILEEVEQEREVAFEVEAVREVQKPVHYTPLSFMGLHRDIDNFVKTGRLAAGCEGYELAFAALRRTALGRKFKIRVDVTSSKLFVSKEFSRTVVLQRGPNDNFLRQVNWILWSTVTEAALIIIPEEAEILIPRIRHAKDSPTHLLTYAAPVTRKMLHFNNLGFYTVPALPAGWKPPTWLTIELGIFSGRLYFDFEEYADLRMFLGLQGDNTELQETVDDVETSAEIHVGDQTVDNDAAGGAVIDTNAQKAQTFTTKPLTFLQEWLAIRRKGQDFTHTPMGHVCQGKSLTASHPFFTRLESNDGSKTDSGGIRNGYGGAGRAGVCVVAPKGGIDGVGDYFDEGEDEDGMFNEDELSGAEDIEQSGTDSDEDM